MTEVNPPDPIWRHENGRNKATITKLASGYECGLTISGTKWVLMGKEPAALIDSAVKALEDLLPPAGAVAEAEKADPKPEAPKTGNIRTVIAPLPPAGDE